MRLIKSKTGITKMTTKIPINELSRELLSESIAIDISIEINQKKVDINIESDFDTLGSNETEYTIETTETLTKEEEAAIDNWVMKRVWNK